MHVKYGIWNTARPDPGAVNGLRNAGYGPLTAMVLAARGLSSPACAAEYIRTNSPLLDPFLMTDMEKAVNRIREALSGHQRMAVFGDYDVDGITATCLLADFLRKNGADCLTYIPGRLEEGYGLNPTAIHQLHEEGVCLIITVDCGITAGPEAVLCQELGMDLIVTDHHECKAQLPKAVAVVDPHRKDGGYPHCTLSGVGVAFKLAAALCGDQNAVLKEYADLVCLGTIADVMLLQGENRVFVSEGLKALSQSKRPGLRSLMEQAGCHPESITATSVGFVLAPRINAAGRMGQVETALDLFLTQDPEEGAEAAAELCRLNRQRQAIEAEIYQQAVSMLPPGKSPEAIVLASDQWHQGVVGIVASRMSEEFCCPTFLICLDGERGKASSRSYGGFNLFAALTALSPLLESYGGHELAAGFTIDKENIPKFREAVIALCREFFWNQGPRSTLELDCAVEPYLLTLSNVEDLSRLEPCGSGCPKPVFLLENMRVDRLTPVGNGRHLRMRLTQGVHSVGCIAFSTTQEALGISQGELVDLACTLQINEYRGTQSVQLSLLDLRPSCPCPCDADPAPYRLMLQNRITQKDAESLCPSRQRLGDVWRYLAAQPRPLLAEPVCLCRKIVRHTGRPLSLSQMLACLDIFQEAGLLTKERQYHDLSITLTVGTGKADLSLCQTMRFLQQLKES